MNSVRICRRRWSVVIGLLLCGWASGALAHSASDAYLSLETAASSGKRTETLVHGQWDIALRDLDFVLKLDANGDGRITWGELKARLPDIAGYAYPKLSFSAGGAVCKLRPVKALVTDHADGAYVALFFDVVCPAASRRVALDYRLFFAIDPSHRGILVWRTGDDTATAVLSPENAKVAVGADPR